MRSVRPRVYQDRTRSDDPGHVHSKKNYTHRAAEVESVNGLMPAGDARFSARTCHRKEASAITSNAAI